MGGVSSHFVKLKCLGEFISHARARVCIYIYIHFIYLFIFKFLAVLGLHCSASFSLVVVCGLLIGVVSLWSMGCRMCRLRELQHVGSAVAAPGL